MSTTTWIVLLVIFVIDTVLSQKVYKHRVRKSEEKFLAHAKVKFPEATITFSTITSSDLDAIQIMREKLDRVEAPK